MTRRALLVSSANPYPVVTNGCARLVGDYLAHAFPNDEVYFLHTRSEDWTPLELRCDGQRVETALDAGSLLAQHFDFLLFVGFRRNEVMLELARSRPSFCLTDAYPHPDVPERLFRGILSHRSPRVAPDLLIVGGSFNDEVFQPDRGAEDLVLTVGRIHPDKQQLELVRWYREQIFDQYGLPLYLAGGIEDPDYYLEVERYIDGVSVVSSIEPTPASAGGGWLSAREIAGLCNRARLFALASPKESFGMALIEAIACGTTCVVNGEYRGFTEADLRPNVYGNITAQRGCVIDLVAQALRDDVRIDGSGWAKNYSLRQTTEKLSRFIDARL